MYLSNTEPIMLGHGSHRYRLDRHWALLNPQILKVKDCHEMVVDRQGRLILLTNETANNVIIFDRSGKVLDSWGHDWPGAHGLTLWEENGEEFLFVTDHNRHQVYKSTLSGKVLMTLNYPVESGLYPSASRYNPTETAIAPNGDIYVADGYGMQYITQYSAKGEYIRTFGGPGKVWLDALATWLPDKYSPPDPDMPYQPYHLNNAHGVTLDTRDPAQARLLISSRMDNVLKVFDLEGQWQADIELPGAFVNRAVIQGEYLYASVLRSDRPSRDETGFVCILDRENRVISNPGGTPPQYANGALQQMQQAEPIFVHPHDVCVDPEENLYIPQWNSGRTLPVKLLRI